MLRTGGQPDASICPSRPQRFRYPLPSTVIMWVETVSLGKVARSSNSTRYPFLASNMAVGAPATRAPITIASYTSVPSCEVELGGEALFGPAAPDLVDRFDTDHGQIVGRFRQGVGRLPGTAAAVD